MENHNNDGKNSKGYDQNHNTNLKKRSSNELGSEKVIKKRKSLQVQEIDLSSSLEESLEEDEVIIIHEIIALKHIKNSKDKQSSENQVSIEESEKQTGSEQCNIKCNIPIKECISTLNLKIKDSAGKSDENGNQPNLEVVEAATCEDEIRQKKENIDKCNIISSKSINYVNAELSISGLQNTDMIYGDTEISKEILEQSEKFVKNSVGQMKRFILLLNEKLHNGFKMDLLPDFSESHNMINSIICFEKINRKTEQTECELYEIKHIVSNEQGKLPKINLRTLSSSEFNIKKYFNIYLKLIKNQQFKMQNKSIKKFVISCNIKINASTFNKSNIEIIEGSKHNSNKIVVSSHSEIFKSLLKESSNLPILAKIISDYIINKETVTLTGIMKKYNKALVNESVLEIKLTKENGRHRYIGKFTQKFIEGVAISESAKDLRQLLKKFLCNPVDESMYINVSSNFGRAFIFDKNPKVQQCDKLAKELVTVISSSITMPKEKISFRKNSSLRNDIEKITGHILTKGDKDVVVFTKAFLDSNTKLPGNLNFLRDLIINKLISKNISFHQLNQCRFKMNDFRDKESHDVAKRLPCKNYCSSTVKEFFKVLEFEVNETEVDSEIAKKIGEEYQLIQDECCVNRIQEELLKWLRFKNEQINPFELIKSQISKTIVMKESSYRPIAIHENRIEFKEEALNEIDINLIESSKKPVILIKTTYPELSVQKIRQIINNIPSYSGDQSLFIKFGKLKNILDRVLNTFESLSTNLLVIECEENLSKLKNIAEICYSLKKAIAKMTNNTKKLVMVGDINSLPEKFKIDTIMIADESINFIDTSEDTQRRLLQDTQVLLHNRRLRIKDLMSREALAKLLMSPTYLTQLLQNKFHIGEKAPVYYSFDQDFYFSRELKQHVIINQAIFREKINDVFMISGIETIDFRDMLLSNEKIVYFYELNSEMQTEAKFILLGINTCSVLESHFDLFVIKNKGSNVHLLRYESKTFVWLKSSNNISALLKHATRDPEYQHKFKSKSDELTKSDPKTTIITGESGAGKSTYLNFLAKRLREESSSPLWIVQLNLEHITPNKLCAESIKDGRAMYFLIEQLGESSALHKRLFMMAVHGMLHLKLVLLIDGLNELYDDQLASTASLLSYLQQDTSVERIYVTSRPKTTVYLERKLGVFAHTLQLFTRAEKLDFLCKCWSVVQLSAAESLLRTYEANGILELTSTPLKLKMLAKIHEPYINSATCLSRECTIIHLRDLYDLYKCFVEHCFKSNLAILQRLSLRKLLRASDYERLGLNKDDTSRSSSADIDKELSHMTFAEYFAAQWLVSEWSSNESIELLDCMDRLVSEASPVFLDSVAAMFKVNDRSCFAHISKRLARTGHANLLAVLSRKRYVQDKDSSDGTALHVAAECGNAQICRLLLEQRSESTIEQTESELLKYVNRLDKNGKSAIELAAENNHVNAACELMHIGANISKLDPKFLQLVALHVAKELLRDRQHRLHPLAERLLNLMPQTITQLNKESDLPAILGHFLAHGRILLVNQLLGALGESERYKLLESSDVQRTLLNSVTENDCLLDDEYLETTRFLLERIEPELRKRDEKYILPVLLAAVRRNQMKTFVYFIDRYPSGSQGFLKLCLLSNNLTGVDFLMRNEFTPGNAALGMAIRLNTNPRIIGYLSDKFLNSSSTEGETALCTAISSGADLFLIKYLLKRGAHINAEDKRGLYPWCYAILEERSLFGRQEQLELMSYLMKEMRYRLELPAGNNRSFRYDRWREELGRKLEFFRNPVGYQLNLEIDGSPRLHASVKSNDTAWCKFLIVQGANIDAQDSQGRTALHLAVEFGRHDLAKLLLQNGAKFNVKDAAKKTPLDSGATGETADLLKRAAKLFATKTKPIELDADLVNCRDERSRSLLHVFLSSDCCKTSLIRDVLKMSADCARCQPDRYFCALDVNTQDSEGTTALHLAARKPSRTSASSLASELLCGGACFESRDYQDRKPADLASESGAREVLDLLNATRGLFAAVEQRDLVAARKHVDFDGHLVNARNASGESALHLACTSDDTLDLVRYLIQQKHTIIDATDLRLRTPLYVATQHDGPECAKLLLKAGATIDAKDFQRHRPFDSPKNCTEMLCSIYQLFEDMRSDKPRIFLDEHVTELLPKRLSALEVKYAIGQDVLVNIRDSKRNTLLHLAAGYGYFTTCECLLRCGAIYNARNKMKKRPLDCAKKAEVQRLLRNVDKAFKDPGAFNSWSDSEIEVLIRCRGIGGYTLLCEAVRAKKLDAVNWLLQRGAKVDVTSNHGSSPLQYAEKKCPAIASLLKKVVQ